MPDTARQDPDHTPQCAHPGCSRPVDGVHLCPGCTDRLRQDLQQLAGTRGLAADLLDTMCRLDVTEPDTSRPAPDADPDDVPHPTDEPIATGRHPVHRGAAAVLEQLARTLRPWVAVVAWARYGRELSGHHRDREHRADGGHGPWRAPLPFRLPHGDVASIAAWLALYPSTLAGHPESGALAARVGRLCGRVPDVVDRRVAVYLGYCEPCAERTPEQGAVDLYADPDAGHVTCRRCGSSWPVPDRRAALLGRAAARWETAGEIERALVDFVRDAYTDEGEDGSRVLADDYRPLTAAAIHAHADRGRIPRWSASRAELEQSLAAGTGRPPARYRVGDVMDLVRELRAERAARAARRSLRAKRGRRHHPTSQISARAVF